MSFRVFFTIISFIFLISTVSAASASDAVIILHFDEGSGTVAHDSSGNNYDGTIQGAQWVDGISGHALEFNGKNNYVTLNKNLALSDNWAIEFWAKSYETSGVVYYPVGLGVGKGIGMGGNFGPIQNDFWIYDGVNILHGGPSVERGTWYFITVVKNGLSYDLYVNGILVKNGQISDIDITEIGFGRGNSNYWYFNGIIDEIAIYPRIVSASEVQTHFAAKNAGNSGSISGTAPSSHLITTSCGYTGINLVANGGFENPTVHSVFETKTGNQLSGWIINSGDLDLIGTYWKPYEGKQSIDLSGYKRCAISQVITTDPDCIYQLSFAMARNPDGGTGIKKVEVYWDGQSKEIFSFDLPTSGSNMGWEVHEIKNLKASGTRTEIKFVDISEGNPTAGVALDAVKVQSSGSATIPMSQTVQNTNVEPGQPSSASTTNQNDIPVLFILLGITGLVATGGGIFYKMKRKTAVEPVKQIQRPYPHQLQYPDQSAIGTFDPAHLPPIPPSSQPHRPLATVMNDLPRKKLIEIIAKHGTGIVCDPAKVKGLLLDYCASSTSSQGGNFQKEIHLLALALAQNIPQDLLTVSQNEPAEFKRTRLKKRLTDLAIEEPAAKWAVESWAEALGIS
jgi:choice-of-anchor C domain-containing protein